MDIMQQEKKQFQVQLFQGVEHGFALRGDIENGYERTFGLANFSIHEFSLTLYRIHERTKSERDSGVV